MSKLLILSNMLILFICKVNIYSYILFKSSIQLKIMLNDIGEIIYSLASSLYYIKADFQIIGKICE